MLYLVCLASRMKISIPMFFALLMSTCWLHSQQVDSIKVVNTEVDTVQFPPLFSLEHPKTFYKQRFMLLSGITTGTYTASSIFLWNAWYKDYPLSSFHTFNDMGEWLQFDKVGHSLGTYNTCNYLFIGALWTGMKRKNAMWTAVGLASVSVATIEIMDGFSEKWGFSGWDIVFNSLGAGLFASQELLWNEQRITLKISSQYLDYSDEPIQAVNSVSTTSIKERAAELYGTASFTTFLKDYNATTYWASVNVNSFLKRPKPSVLASCLNLAIGYGAENLYGGFENKWIKDGVEYELDSKSHPRYRQFLLSPDIDFTRIPTKHKWLKFALKMINILKVPAPALEYNTRGKFSIHGLYR